MTHNTPLSIFSGLILFINSFTASAAVHTAASVALGNTKEMTKAVLADSKEPAMAEQGRGLPAARTEPPFEKRQKPVTEELAHIHHFHKERVKKIKRHHEKYWVVSKILLILCHLTLLVIAYLHISH